MCGIIEWIQMSDEDFYEKYLAKLSLEEQAAFLEEFPDFLKEEPLEYEAEKDEIYKKIKKILTGKQGMSAG